MVSPERVGSSSRLSPPEAARRRGQFRGLNSYQGRSAFVRTIRKVFWLLIAGCVAWTVAGCEKGPLEKAGKAVDDKVNDIKR